MSLCAACIRYLDYYAYNHTAAFALNVVKQNTGRFMPP